MYDIHSIVVLVCTGEALPGIRPARRTNNKETAGVKAGSLRIARTVQRGILFTGIISPDDLISYVGRRIEIHDLLAGLQYERVIALVAELLRYR